MMHVDSSWKHLSMQKIAMPMKLYLNPSCETEWKCIFNDVTNFSTCCKACSIHTIKVV
jgi:hypothetical protein